jgi:hypothetical protein
MGDCRPVNIYKGETKIAGWENQTLSGESAEFLDTYNDVANVLADGVSVESSDYKAKDGLSSLISDYKF